jgi:phospholipase/carboxylesterase
METIEISTGANPDASIIWLHGLGADGRDFEPIVPELGLPAALQVRFIFPHAPVRPVTINQRMRMRAWYDIFQLGGGAEDEEGIRASQQLVENLIASENKRGIPSQRIVLAGFSQGGAIALQAGLRAKERLGGIVALSTYLPLEDSLDREASGANKSTRIFMAHGTEDPIIPMQLAERSKQALTQRGYEVEWHSYPMPHAVCAEEVEALGHFLATAFGASDAKPRSSSILLP